MPLPSGTSVGSYTITARIGAGGMGEVYRASDLKLDREVALKVLPESLAGDPERLARLKREARILAALNHHNIAQIYGLEDSGHTHALVLELVDGETLADRIARGPLRVDDALSCALQIAEALEAAHERGIVHGDLKPANIKLRHDGALKVLDFGLATAREPRSSIDAAPPVASTIISPADEAQGGRVRGTPAYMSPEQAAGRTADARSDMWAFGVVLMEMLTGRRVFTGQTATRVLAAVLEDEPDWTQLPSTTPAAIRTLLRRCLEKDRRRRIDSAAAARLEIEDALERDAEVPPISRWSRREVAAWIVSAALAAATAALGVRLLRSPAAAEVHVRKLSLLPPAGTTVNRDYVALSPDGRYLAFVASMSSGRSQLWIRELDELTSRPLPGTDDARLPFWSPDSRFIGFFAERKLKKVLVPGGPVQIVCDAPYGFGGTWNRAGTIVFSPDVNTGLLQVSAEGGQPRPATVLSNGNAVGGHSAPVFLPDGQRFMYVARVERKRAVVIGSLDSTEGHPLLHADSMAVYAHAPGLPEDDGFLLYVRDSVLLAQRFNATARVLSGEALPVADDELHVDVVGATAPFSVTDTSLLAYRSFSANTQLVWVDREGQRLRTVGEPARYNAVELAPDDRQIVVERVNPRAGNRDLWLMDLASGESAQLTFTGAADPRWSPDSKTVTFDRADQIIRKRLDATTNEDVLYRASDRLAMATLSDWSPDGRTYIIRALPPAGGGQAGSLWLLPAVAGSHPTPLPQTEASGFNGRFSPDGKWVAYTSNESGITEVYVQPFPSTGSKWKVSQNGGIRPLWTHDGREVFFVATGNLNGAGLLTAVSVELTPTVRIGTPHPIVEAAFVPRTANGYPYAVSGDGQRILMIQPIDDPNSATITVVSDWATRLSAK